MDIVSTPRTEVCRMPWFLVEVKASSKTINSEYFIVHSVDINEMLSSHMYVNGSVKFEYNQRFVEGTVLLASEDRAIVEDEKRQLTIKLEHNKNNEKYFFIQYSSNIRSLVHTVVPERDIYTSPEAHFNQKEVFVKIDEKLQRANVLLTTENVNQIEKNFEKVKNWCLNRGLDKNTLSTNQCAANVWLLVQYSKSPMETVYEVFNEREIQWQSQNLYKDVVTYIQVGEIIFQALILAKSPDLQHLLLEINKIKEFAAMNPLIQEGNNENRNLTSLAVRSSYPQFAEALLNKTGFTFK